MIITSMTPFSYLEVLLESMDAIFFRRNINSITNKATTKKSAYAYTCETYAGLCMGLLRHQCIRNGVNKTSMMGNIEL